MATHHWKKVCGKLLQWIQSYLSNWSITVVLSGQVSQPCSIKPETGSPANKHLGKLIVGPHRTIKVQVCGTQEKRVFHQCWSCALIGYQLTTAHPGSLSRSWSTYLTNISIRAGRKLEALWRQASKLNTETKPRSTSPKSAVSFNMFHLAGRVEQRRKYG